jgi:hypothetical protein
MRNNTVNGEWRKSHEREKGMKKPENGTKL